MKVTEGADRMEMQCPMSGAFALERGGHTISLRHERNGLTSNSMGKPGLKVGALNSYPDGPSVFCKRTMIRSVKSGQGATDLREFGEILKLHPWNR